MTPNDCCSTARMLRISLLLGVFFLTYAVYRVPTMTDPVTLSYNRHRSHIRLPYELIQWINPYLDFKIIPGLVRNDYNGIRVAKVPFGYIYNPTKRIWSAQFHDFFKETTPTPPDQEFIYISDLSWNETLMAFATVAIVTILVLC